MPELEKEHVYNAADAMFELSETLLSLTIKGAIQWFPAGNAGYVCFEIFPPAFIYVGRLREDGYYFQRYQEGHESWIFLIGSDKPWVDDKGRERKPYQELYEQCEKSSERMPPVGDAVDKILAVRDRLQKMESQRKP